MIQTLLIIVIMTILLFSTWSVSNQVYHLKMLLTESFLSEVLGRKEKRSEHFQS